MTSSKAIKETDPLADAMGAESIHVRQHEGPEASNPQGVFAGLRVDTARRKVFAGSATVIEPEVRKFVEALYEAFQADPSWWYPHEAASAGELDKINDQAKSYARTRAEGQVTVSMRREPGKDAMGWFRVSGYTKRPRKVKEGDTGAAA